MGIGCVLAFWAIALVALAVASASLLLWIAGRTGDPGRRPRVSKWLVIAVPATVAYAVLALSAYWASCEARGVDPGIGDSFFVPLVGGYSLSFGDTLDQAFVTPRSRTNWPAISDVTAVGEAGPYVFGIAPDKAFVVDTRTGQVQSLKDPAALVNRLELLGFQGSQMAPVRDVYLSKRWSRADVVIAAIFGVPGSVVLVATFLIAWFGIRFRSVSEAPA